MTGLPAVTGLFEAHLTVADLDRSVAFWRDVVGLPVAHEVPERGAAFLWVGAPGTTMLGLWTLGSAPVGLSLHVALRARLDDVLGAPDALRAAGVAPLTFFGEPATEPSVIGWMPAASVFFRDPDGHLVEYLAMLDASPRPELGVVPWSAWATAAAAPLRIEPHIGDRRALRPLFEEADDSPQRLDATMDDGDVLVARLGDRTVGHLQLVDGPGAGEAEIATMAVEAGQRGRGTGMALVREALRLARERGCARLVVATAAADTGNLRFYQRAGFRLRAVQRDAFTPATGYADGIVLDGVPLRDRVWLDLDLDRDRR